MTSRRDTGPGAGSSSWGDVAVKLAGQFGRPDFPRGNLAELRRMNPEGPRAAVFYRLMAQHELPGGPALEGKWALIFHGIALMTPTAATGGGGRTAHDGLKPVGRALYLGGESHRRSALYSEARLNRLLTAGGPMLRALLARMFRMLASDGASFNWREMAQFILNEGHDEERAEQGRRRIARTYFDAERRTHAADGGTQD